MHVCVMEHHKCVRGEQERESALAGSTDWESDSCAVTAFVAAVSAVAYV